MKNMIKYLTLEGLEKLKKELNYLKTVKRRESAETLRHTASFGDLSENFAYQQAKEDQAFLEGRILELGKIISQAKIIEKRKTDKVQLSSLVIVNLAGKKEKFQILGPEEADPAKGKISFESPLGKALLGKKVGNKIKIKTLDGKLEGEILKIE
ncbi:MAG: transcription elongation factor GreA [Candidatus Pacebacteria bacterium]|nr:transcription elongation factor GreA [Candidatus Paceibacterota bacterium]